MSNSRFGLRSRTGLVRSYTEGLGATSYLLDLYQNASAAYSMRRLRDAYTGSCIKVRRSSDNTEQDINFDTNGYLDENALTTFVGANNAFITTWYDQSGNGRDATQSTAVNQPQIVTSGTIEKQNNKVVIKFDGSNDYLTANGSYSLATHSLFATAKSVNNANVKTIFGRSSSSVSSDRREAFSYILSAEYHLQVSNNSNFPTAIKGFTSTNYALFTAITQGATGTMANYINGSVGTTATSVASGLSGTIVTTIGTVYQASGLSFYYEGSLGEIIVYAINQSSNQAAIESNINAYYGIY